MCCRAATMLPNLLRATHACSLSRFMLVCRAAASSSCRPPQSWTRPSMASQHLVLVRVLHPKLRCNGVTYCCCAGPLRPCYGLNWSEWLCQIEAAASSLVRVSLSWAVPALQEECEVCRARQANRVAQDTVGGGATSHLAQVGAEAEKGDCKPALQKMLLPAVM